MATANNAAPKGAAPSQRDAAAGTLIRRFWQRISDGLEIQELWKQFEAETRASYGLYSAEVDWDAVQQKKGIGRAFAVGKAFFWAMVMKLTPARRVLLVIALAIVVKGLLQIQLIIFAPLWAHLAFAILLLLLLLTLELADRVTMKRDLEIAREIQRWLVPEKPPDVAGLDIAFATRPANTVAGDYYDAFFRDAERHKLLLVVADVAGKSVPAALLMATFQASLHSSAHDAATLGDLVERLNRFACLRSLNGQRFTTAFLAELDVESCTMTYVNAGHNAPILRRVTGEVERLEKGGVPFGIDPESRYETGTVRLERHDVLLVFTDGLIEAFNPAGEEYGESRVLYMLQTVPGESAGELIRHTIEDVDRFVGYTRQHDDMTFLVVRAV
jgi:sigma-B regulation protein RsbU (phosphoserine phosphatase)